MHLEWFVQFVIVGSSRKWGPVLLSIEKPPAYICISIVIGLLYDWGSALILIRQNEQHHGEDITHSNINTLSNVLIIIGNK